MKRLFITLISHTTKVANQLVPTTCLLCGCGLRGELLCSGCEMDLPHLARAEHLCQQCALPLSAEAGFCGHCLHKPPAFSHSVIPFSYQHPLDYLIHRFKYRRQLPCGKALALALGAFIQHHYDEHPDEWPDVIIPVPLHWLRRLQRGFNQAEVIGAELAQQLHIPLETHVCKRSKRTPSQKGLSRAERQDNLRKAFTVSAESAHKIRGKCVALLDDVVTTTATARELSNLLVQQGARAVHIWALARTPEKH
jgi:ComF family protein